MSRPIATPFVNRSRNKQPMSTIAEACARIERLTGLQRRGPTQVRQFLKALGLKWQRMRAIPVPPQKTGPSTSPTRPCFTTSHCSRGLMPL